MVNDHVAVAVDHLLDDHRVAACSAVGDGGVGAGHLEGGDLLGAERDRHDGVELGGDTEPVGHLHDVLGAHGRADAHEAGVGGDGERARDAAGAVVGAAVVLNLVAVELEAGRAAHLRVRRNPLLKSGHEREGLERGAGLALGLGREVPLVRVEVLAAHHGLDEAGVWVDRRQGDGQVGVEARLVLVDHLLGERLRGHVKRGVDGQAALEERCRVELVGAQELVAHVAREVGVEDEAVHGDV